MFSGYVTKSNDLWLTQEYDEISSEFIENNPKLALVFAMDWYTYFQRPSRFRDSIKMVEVYRKTFHVTIYAGYYQIHLDVKLNKLPYQNYEEYVDYRRKNRKK